MPDNTFDIKGGSNQILPNVQEGKQYFIGDSAIKLAQQQANSEVLKAQLVDMTYFSGTFPEEVDHELWREIHLSLCEEKLKDNTVVCLTGEDGVGMTTFLSQFARKHGNNCVSYFYNGFDHIQLDTEVMEGDITEQLFWFANKYNCPPEVKHVNDIYSKVLRQLRQSKDGVMYFVFDGFDEIPSVHKENICKLIEKLQWEKARFLLSGKKEQIEGLFKQTKKWSVSEVPLLRFSEADTNDYFTRAYPGLSKEQLFELYKISRGKASRMNALRTKYLCNDRLEELMNADIDENSDLNLEDFELICEDSDSAVLPMFALLAYAEFEFDIDFLAMVLETSTENVETLVERYSDYIQVKYDGSIALRSVVFRKYLCDRLQDHKRDIELSQIRVLEGMTVGTGYAMALPSLYRSAGLNDNLIKYLNADNIQRILAEGHSQAALNVQCRFGYEACAAVPSRHPSSYFRYSLNMAVSREIERNELMDYEISALIAVGQHVKALALAHTVYLSEERLKCYLIIARKRDGLSPDDYAVLKDNIRQLVDEIRFEDIPDKAMELAKLLLPIDYKAAIAIVDRINKAYQEDINTDKIFSQFSLFEPVDPEEDDARRDLARSKIQDTGLREFIDATENLFRKDDVDTFLDELKRLPNYAQQLRLLRYWLPAHQDKEDIGKVVLEALRLIVADSDTDMPKARELNDIARLMGTMTKEQMEEGLRYINSLGDTIMRPTSDYVDAMITVIEGSRDALPDKSQALLETLYIFVDDLKDDGMWLTCTAKLLGHFDRLGDSCMVERTIGTKDQLRSELKAKASQLFLATAYHMKVVEGPIAALVCTEPELIEKFIAQVNTAERRSRAYSYAAEQYLVHVEPEKLDLDYFFRLLTKAEIKRGDCGNPLNSLTNKLLTTEKYNHAALLPFVKTHIKFVDRLEDVWLQCTICMRLYRWVDRHFPDDPFVNDVKGRMLSYWEAINQRQDKIERGFYIAKILARRSKDEAENMIARCSELRHQGMLTSSSCVEAFYNCYTLYANSLITLISRGICDEQTLQAFKEDVNDLVNDSERACMLGKIALAYHLAGDEEMFKSVGDQFLPTDYSSFPTDVQKWLIYQISPTLYLRGQLKFFTLLDGYDDVFRDVCLKRVCAFVISKKLDFMDLDIKTTYELTYSDFNDLNTLIDHMKDENVLFLIVEVIARSLRTTNRTLEPLSTQQKNAVRETTSSIVERKYPAPGGISHEGYKIACQAILEYSLHAFNTTQKEVWDRRLQSVDNKADRAFLYFYIAPFFARHPDKEDFLRRGIEVTRDVHFAFDRLSRLDMAFTECAINNLVILMPAVAEEAILCLKTDGTEEQYEGLLDTIHQYKPELAESIIVKLDQDPARVYNKLKLQSHLDSVKRIAKAGKDITTVGDLDRDEQRKFFEERLKNLQNGKGQVLAVEDAFALTIGYLYNNALTDAMPAIHYLLETISQRQKMNKNCKDLLLSMHKVIRYNLRVVLSLASDTKERMEQVNSMFGSAPATPDSFIGLGEYQKGVDYLLQWYRECGYGELTIIDPHFRPSDLPVIKQLTDENNDLAIRILSHKGDFCVEDFTSEWRKVSAGVKTPIRVMLVKYVGKSYGGPIHDRYWICVDDENDKRVGLSLNSISGLGQRESSILTIDDSIALHALYSYSRYVGRKIKRDNNMELEYEDFVLE
jgi:hypothetical protein